MAALADAARRRVVTLDIERVPGRFRATWRGLTVEGDFWDLSDGKRHIGRRISPDEVTAWPETICAAWRELGQRQYGFSSVWSSETFTEDLADVLDQADILVGHNIDNFDLKKINAQLWLAGKQVPSPYKTVDTLKILRSRMGLESNTLRSACDRAGIVTKVDHYDPAVAKAAIAGDVKAQRRIERYNKGDIAATEALYGRLLGWIWNHPHVAIETGEIAKCNACGSDQLERLPKDYLAVQNERAAYRCKRCRGVVTMAHTRRVARTRGVR